MIPDPDGVIREFVGTDGVTYEAVEVAGHTCTGCAFEKDRGEILCLTAANCSPMKLPAHKTLIWVKKA